MSAPVSPVFPRLPFGVTDAIGYTIASIKAARRRFYPFLWRDLDKADLMAVARSLAWLILVEDRPQTRRELWNATQRRLYAEAKSWGWRREWAHGMRYDQRVRVMAEVERQPGAQPEAPGALRGEVVAELMKLMTLDEVAIIGGLVADLSEDEIAENLSLPVEEIRRKRREIRRKLRQELKANLKNTKGKNEKGKWC